MSVAIDPRRVEEAGLNAMQTPRQLFYDGWLLRLSPGKARRARSVNPHFGSTQPVQRKIDHCERVYEAKGLPTLFRMTPFVQPADLARALDDRGYVAFDETLVQAMTLDRAPETFPIEAELVAVDPRAFVEAIGAMRGSAREQQAAHLERLAQTPLETRAVVARHEGRAVAGGQIAFDDGLVGVFDVVTHERFRGRGIGTALVATLLARAWDRGARAAYLQVDAANAPALAIYRRLGFRTLYTYHYRGREAEAA